MWAFSNKNNKKRQILIENIKAKDKAYKEKEKRVGDGGKGTS